MTEDIMVLAREMAARCWCDKETEHLEMNAVLAEAFAKRLACWLESAAQFSRNADFYRNLLDECAKPLGVEAYTADDGTVADSPIRLKIPELVARLAAQKGE